MSIEQQSSDNSSGGLSESDFEALINGLQIFLLVGFFFQPASQAPVLQECELNPGSSAIYLGFLLSIGPAFANGLMLSCV